MEFHSGIRLKLAKELKSLVWKEIADVVNLTDSAVKKWAKGGIKDSSIAAIANFFEVDEWVFSDKNLSEEYFKKIIFNPSLQEELKPESFPSEFSGTDLAKISDMEIDELSGIDLDIFFGIDFDQLSMKDSQKIEDVDFNKLPCINRDRFSGVELNSFRLIDSDDLLEISRKKKAYWTDQACQRFFAFPRNDIPSDIDLDKFSKINFYKLSNIDFGKLSNIDFDENHWNLCVAPRTHNDIISEIERGGEFTRSDIEEFVKRANEEFAEFYSNIQLCFTKTIKDKKMTLYEKFATVHDIRRKIWKNNFFKFISSLDYQNIDLKIENNRIEFSNHMFISKLLMRHFL